jgi:hypothetical protein
MRPNGSNLPRGLYGGGGVAKVLRDERSAYQSPSTCKSSSFQNDDTNPIETSYYVAYSLPAHQTWQYSQTMSPVGSQQVLPSPSYMTVPSFAIRQPPSVPMSPLASRHVLPSPFCANSSIHSPQEPQTDRARQIEDPQEFSIDFRHRDRSPSPPQICKETSIRYNDDSDDITEGSLSDDAGIASDDSLSDSDDLSVASQALDYGYEEDAIYGSDFEGDISEELPLDDTNVLLRDDGGIDDDPNRNFNQDRYSCSASTTTFNASLPVNDMPQDPSPVNDFKNFTFDDCGCEATTFDVTENLTPDTNILNQLNIEFPDHSTHIVQDHGYDEFPAAPQEKDCINAREDVSTERRLENFERNNEETDIALRYFSMTTVHANPVSIRRSFIRTAKQRPKPLLLSHHVLLIDELLFQVLFHMPPGVPSLLGSPSLSGPQVQDDQETQVIRIYDPIDCKTRLLFSFTMPTSKTENFWPMKIEPSPTPPLVTPAERQLAQRTISLVPHKRCAGKEFSLSLALSLLQADNFVYKSVDDAVPMATICLDLLQADDAFYRSLFHTVPRETKHLDFPQADDGFYRSGIFLINEKFRFSGLATHFLQPA